MMEPTDEPDPDVTVPVPLSDTTRAGEDGLADPSTMAPAPAVVPEISSGGMTPPITRPGATVAPPSSMAPMSGRTP